MTTPGGHRKFWRSDLIEFMQNYSIPLQGMQEDKKKILYVNNLVDIHSGIQYVIEINQSPVIFDAAYDSVGGLLKITLNKPNLVLLKTKIPW